MWMWKWQTHMEILINDGVRFSFHFKVISLFGFIYAICQFYWNREIYMLNIYMTCMQVRKQQLKLDMEEQTGSK